MEENKDIKEENIELIDEKEFKEKTSFKEKLHTAKEWILDHGKIVMPVILLVCVAVTVIIALNANREDKLNKAAESAALEAQTQTETTAETSTLDAPQYELEENAYPEVNAVVKDYYDAMAKGDMLTVCSLNSYIDDVEKIRIEEQSKYIESYPEITVYTKPGLSENTYVVYAATKTKFTDLDTSVPGMKTYYVTIGSDGENSISDGTFDDSIYDYISSVTLQDDVVDLNNRIVVEYNDLLSENEEVNEYIAYLKEKINEEVGVMLADLEKTEDTTETTESTEENATDTAVVVTKVKATDVVNIRVSDSEGADKVGKAQKGQEFVLVEEKPNGWSEIEYEDGTAFIKSEYLEAVQTVTIGDGDTENTSTDNTETADTDTTTDSSSSTKKAKVNDSGVRIRKEASTDSDIITSLYEGTEVELIESMSNGWSKIKYNGQTGYIKSEYLDD